MKYTLKILSFITFTILSKGIFAYSDDLPITSNGEIKFYLDLAGFKGEGKKTHQEFYLMFFEDELQNSKTKSNKKIVEIETSLKDNFGKAISSKSWTTEIMFKRDSSKINYFAVYDQWAEQIAPGNYKLKVRVYDPSTDRSGNVNTDILIKNFVTSSLRASDIEFVSSHEKNNFKDQFLKGERTVKPNPWRRYGILAPTLFFYYELYNLPTFIGDSLLLQYEIVNIEGETVKNFPKTKFSYSDKSKAVLHGLNVVSLKSGIYKLGIAVKNILSEELLYFTRSFEVIQSDYLALLENSNEQLEMSQNVIQYLASPMELEYYEKLNDRAKVQYLATFWKSKDTNPDDDINQYFSTIYNRYNYSNINFSWGKIEGWESERGRVYIQNGNPDEISRYYFEDGYKPYEVWEYTSDRQFVFVFCDTQLNDKFILLHSTKVGEVSNFDWRYQAAR